MASESYTQRTEALQASVEIDKRQLIALGKKGDRDDRSGEFSSCSRNESGRRREATEGHAAVQFNAINVEPCGQPDIFNAARTELQQNFG